MRYSDKNKSEPKHIQIQNKLNSYGLRYSLHWIGDKIIDVEFDDTKLTTEQKTELKNYINSNFPNLQEESD